MVVKCPRWTSARLELSKDEPFNPIRQESGKSGRPLFIRQVFPHHGYDWNYGILPQVLGVHDYVLLYAKDFALSPFHRHGKILRARMTTGRRVIKVTVLH